MISPRESTCARARAHAIGSSRIKTKPSQLQTFFPARGSGHTRTHTNTKRSPIDHRRQVQVHCFRRARAAFVCRSCSLAGSGSDKLLPSSSRVVRGATDGLIGQDSIRQEPPHINLISKSTLSARSRAVRQRLHSRCCFLLSSVLTLSTGKMLTAQGIRLPCCTTLGVAWVGHGRADLACSPMLAA